MLFAFFFHPFCPLSSLRSPLPRSPIQTSWFISEGNGGESRKSFHGYPQGYAQLLESPTTWHITPMQIDTRNRAHGVGPESVHNCTNMTECAGPEPRQARYGRGWGGLTEKNKNVGGYSGILECPCNGRYGGDPQFYPTQNTKVRADTLYDIHTIYIRY